MSEELSITAGAGTMAPFAISSQVFTPTQVSYLRTMKRPALLISKVGTSKSMVVSWVGTSSRALTTAMEKPAWRDTVC